MTSQPSSPKPKPKEVVFYSSKRMSGRTKGGVNKDAVGFGKSSFDRQHKDFMESRKKLEQAGSHIFVDIDRVPLIDKTKDRKHGHFMNDGRKKAMRRAEAHVKKNPSLDKDQVYQQIKDEGHIRAGLEMLTDHGMRDSDGKLWKASSVALQDNQAWNLSEEDLKGMKFSMAHSDPQMAKALEEALGDKGIETSVKHMKDKDVGEMMHSAGVWERSDVDSFQYKEKPKPPYREYVTPKKEAPKPPALDKGKEDPEVDKGGISAKSPGGTFDTVNSMMNGASPGQAQDMAQNNMLLQIIQALAQAMQSIFGNPLSQPGMQQQQMGGMQQGFDPNMFMSQFMQAMGMMMQQAGRQQQMGYGSPMGFQMQQSYLPQQQMSSLQESLGQLTDTNKELTKLVTDQSKTISDMETRISDMEKRLGIKTQDPSDPSTPKQKGPKGLSDRERLAKQLGVEDNAQNRGLIDDAIKNERMEQLEREARLKKLEDPKDAPKKQNDKVGRSLDKTKFDHIRPESESAEMDKIFETRRQERIDELQGFKKDNIDVDKTKQKYTEPQRSTMEDAPGRKERLKEAQEIGERRKQEQVRSDIDKGSTKLDAFLKKEQEKRDAQKRTHQFKQDIRNATGATFQEQLQSIGKARERRLQKSKRGPGVSEVSKEVGHSKSAVSKDLETVELERQKRMKQQLSKQHSREW